MKYVFFLFIGLTSLFSYSLATAQTTTSTVDMNAPYMKDKHVPLFSITSIDGKEITNKQLPTKYKYTCIIIFSPDCSHCEHEAGELNKYADKLKDVLFIWDSYRDMESIKKFANRFNLVGQANIVVGRDPAFTIPTFYRPKMTPFVALYEKNNLVKVWEQGADVFELIKIIQGN